MSKLTNLINHLVKKHKFISYLHIWFILVIEKRHSILKMLYLQILFFIKKYCTFHFKFSKAFSNVNLNKFFLKKTDILRSKYYYFEFEKKSFNSSFVTVQKIVTNSLLDIDQHVLKNVLNHNFEFSCVPSCLFVW